MQAFVTRLLRTPIVKTVSIPEPRAGEVLVRVRAAALNPTDWKHAGVCLSWKGLIVGCDCAGEVESWGAGVKGFEKGERVGGLVHGCSSTSIGAFAEFTIVKASLLWKIPDSISFEEASTMGVSTCSSSFALDKLGWKVPGGEKKTEGASEPLLLYSAGTSTGLATLQLSRLLRSSSSSETETITFSSSTHFPLLRSLGATTTLPYNPLPTPKEIHSIAPHLNQIIDFFSEGKTTSTCFGFLGEEGGRVIRTIPPFGVTAPPGVEVDWILTYFATGEPFTFIFKSYEPSLYLHNIAAETLRALPGWLEEGKIKPLPFEVLPGGLEGLTEGFRRLKAGEVKGKKLVVSL